MVVNLIGRVIGWKDSGPYFNVLHKVKNLKELVQAVQELVAQRCKYDPELSYEISTESIVAIFKPPEAPKIILELPVKYKPFSNKFKRYEEKVRKIINQYIPTNP
jgi:hypothetical protein